jgi:hypothetical protein
MSYQWKVAALDYEVSQDGLSNVVTTVHWTCSKEDENGNTGYSYGTHGLPEPDPSNFTAWDDLDEFTVLSWIAVDMVARPSGTTPDTVQASVDAQIAEKAAPTHGTGVPW